MNDTMGFGMDPVVAIVGMAGRFPGARSVEALWALLQEGREGIGPVQDLRLGAAAVPDCLLGSPGYVGRAGYLEDIDQFDPEFFGFSPRQAADLDPQQRLFLECAWEALEDAGVDPHRFDGAIGVFAGAGPVRYSMERITADARQQRVLDLVRQTLNIDKDFLATRVSYKLNLRGPSVSVQTACSTSLVAVHMACQSLLSGECDMALAGGVNIPIPHGLGYLYSEGGILSPDGRCRAFDKLAGGTVPGAGVGIVVLRRQEDARTAQHRAYAAIRNSAINNDGHAKVGYTAPSVQGQRDVLEMALAGTDPRSIGMIEAHGTGTAMGDAVELTALSEAFLAAGAAARSCAIGSIKTNIGHLDAAAGIAGLIKAALCLDRKQLVPSLHLSQPHPLLEAAGVPFFVNTAARPWQASTTPRRAGVSSFGMGGTNAHVVLEEAPQAVGELTRAGDAGTAAELFPLAAKSRPALQAMARQLARHVAVHADVPLADIAHTLQCGRAHFDLRAVVIASTHAELARQLEDIAGTEAVQAAASALVLHLDAAPHMPGPVAAASDAAWQHDHDDLQQGLGGAAAAADWAGVLDQICRARALLRHGVVPDSVVAAGVNVLAAACVAGAVAPLECGRLLALAGQGPDALAGHLRLAGTLAWPVRVGRAGAVLAAEQLSLPAFWARCLAEDTTDVRLSSEPAQVLPCSTSALGAWLQRHGTGLRHGAQATAMQRVLAALWLGGARVDWARAGSPGRLTRLPSYPFQRSSHWLDDTPPPGPLAHHLPAWKPAPLPPVAPSSAPGTWLLVAGPGGFADEVAERIASVGGSCHRVLLAAGTGAPVDWQAVWAPLRAAGTPVARVLYVPPETPGAPQRAQDLADGQAGSFFAVLALARAAASLQPASPLTICIATRRLSADLQQQTDAQAEALAALPALLPQVAARLAAKVVDLGPAPTGEAECRQQAQALVAEAAQASGPCWLAYRSGRRLRLGFDEVPAAPAGGPMPGVLRTGGVYLITGGLGSIGLALARSLAASHGATLLLLGRHGLPPRPQWPALTEDLALGRVRAVQAIEQAGGRVELLVADVADAQALGQAVRQAEQRHGPVNGVFHLAAALDDPSAAMPVDRLLPEHLARQLRPKAGGMLAIEQVFASCALDFAVVFSSNSALLGGTGLAAYAAANAVVDGLARSQRRCGGAGWMALGWDGWAGPGASLQGALVVAMEEGLAALMQALGWRGLAQVAVSRQPFASRLPYLQAPAPADAAPAAPRAVAGAGDDRAGALGPNQLEALVTRIWEDTLGRAGIRPDDDFFKLGGDSLAMLGVTDRVAELLHIEVPLREFLRAGLTVRGFSQTVLTQMAALARTESHTQPSEGVVTP